MTWTCIVVFSFKKAANLPDKVVLPEAGKPHRMTNGMWWARQGKAMQGRRGEASLVAKSSGHATPHHFN